MLQLNKLVLCMFVYMGRTKIIGMLQLIRRTVSLTNPAHALRLVPSWLRSVLRDRDPPPSPQRTQTHAIDVQTGHPARTRPEPVLARYE
jgi:hypothetical protein